MGWLNILRRDGADAVRLDPVGMVILTGDLSHGFLRVDVNRVDRSFRLLLLASPSDRDVAALATSDWQEHDTLPATVYLSQQNNSGISASVQVIDA